MINGVIGIGNALVDIMVRLESEELLERLSLPPGSMQLIERERSHEMTAAVNHMAERITSGGSVANTIYALGMMKADAGYIGSVGNDSYGTLFRDELTRAGVSARLFTSDLPTGTAIAFISPGGERTFATYTGAAAALNEDDLDAGIYDGYDLLYLEGYLIFNLPLVVRSLQLAKERGMLVALDLSGYNIVEEARENFKMVVADYVDILFANEEEAYAFTGQDAERAARSLSEICDIAVVKRGREGSVISRGSDFIAVGAVGGDAVDTTGAGDMFAAGFLYGMTRGWQIERCGRAGSLLAGHIVESVGARPADHKWSTIEREMGR